MIKFYVPQWQSWKLTSFKDQCKMSVSSCRCPTSDSSNSCLCLCDASLRRWPRRKYPGLPRRSPRKGRSNCTLPLKPNEKPRKLVKICHNQIINLISIYCLIIHLHSKKKQKHTSSYQVTSACCMELEMRRERFRVTGVFPADPTRDEE